MDDAEEGYMRVRGGIRVHTGKPHSTVDEGEGNVVMLYYHLFWWTMQRRDAGG